MGRGSSACLNVAAFQEAVLLLTTLYASPWPTMEQEEMVSDEVQTEAALQPCSSYEEFAAQLTTHYPRLVATVKAQLELGFIKEL